MGPGWSWLFGCFPSVLWSGPSCCSSQCSYVAAIKQPALCFTAAVQQAFEEENSKHSEDVWGRKSVLKCLSLCNDGFVTIACDSLNTNVGYGVGNGESSSNICIEKFLLSCEIDRAFEYKKEMGAPRGCGLKLILLALRLTRVGALQLLTAVVGLKNT